MLPGWWRLHRYQGNSSNSGMLVGIANSGSFHEPPGTSGIKTVGFQEKGIHNLLGLVQGKAAASGSALKTARYTGQSGRELWPGGEHP